MSALKRFGVGLAIVALVAAAGVLLARLLHPVAGEVGSNEPSTGAIDKEGRVRQVEADANETGTRRVARLDERAPIVGELAPSLGELAHLCPSLIGEFVPECMDALDRRYLDSIPHGLRRPLPPTRPVAWRDVFGDVMATHSAVSDALQDRKCHVPAGEIRPELREVCAAREMVKLSLLQSGCSQLLRLDELPELSRFKGWQEVDLEAYRDRRVHDLAGETEDGADYWRRRSGLEDGAFRSSWKLRKCREVRTEAMGWVAGLPTPHGHPGQSDQSLDLLRMAARLGDGVALRRYRAHRSDPAHHNALAELNPALAYVHLAQAASGTEHFLPFMLTARHYAKVSGVSFDQFAFDLTRFSDDALALAERRAQVVINAGWKPLPEG